jgi:hypothetical protein
VASLAGLAVVPEPAGNDPGTGGHREVHIVWWQHRTTGWIGGVTGMSDGFTLRGMSMVITLRVPDETARRIEAVAAARGETIEELAREVFDSSPLLADDGADDGLPPLSFIGLGEGRPDLAERHGEILAEHLRTAS